MASDNFTGADDTALETHDSNWTSINATYPVSNLEIISNTVRHEAIWQLSGAYYNGSSVDSSQIVFKAGTNGSQSRNVSVRAGSDQRGYSASLTTISSGNYTYFNISKNGAWLSTLETSGAWSVTADHTVKITASGSSTVTIEGFVDGSSEGTTSDSSSPIGAGHPGFWTGELGTIAEGVYDDWTDGDTGGASSINVAATCPGLVVTQYDATVNAEVSIAAGYDELTLTQYPATVNAEISVAATLEELTLTTYGASISAGVNVAATCPSLTITQYKAAIKADTTFTAGYDELIVTAYVADVDIDVNVVGTCQALTLTAYDATVKVDTNILASFDELILTTPAATVSVAALEYTLMTEGVFIMVDLGGGVVYLKPASPKIKAAISTGHVTEI